MLTIYGRWILGICLRFGNNLSKRAHFLILTDQNWTFAQIYRKGTAVEKQQLLVVMELQSNANHIRKIDVRDLPMT